MNDRDLNQTIQKRFDELVSTAQAREAASSDPAEMDALLRLVEEWSFEEVAAI